MKNILVIGLGRFGRHMAIKLIEEGNDVLAIDNSNERVEGAMEYIRNVQIGDTTNEQVIKSLGVDNFDMCVVAIGDSFQQALETTVLLKDNGAKFILARATRQVHKKLLLRNGADHVVYGERELAEKLAVKYGAKNIFDYIELTPEYSIYEIATPKSWVGKSIVDVDVRKKYSVSILGTKENDVLSPNPSPQHIFSNKETLLVMGENTVIEKMIKKNK